MIDELCKMLPQKEGLSVSGWNLSVWAECIGLLESDARLLAHDWSEDDVERLRRHVFILAGGAFQLALEEVREASTRGSLGFVPGGGPKGTHAQAVARYLPEEILSRFADPIILLPPSRKDFADAIERIHSTLNVPQRRPLESLLDEAIAAGGGMRWVEHYLCQLLVDHPHVVAPRQDPPKTDSKPKHFDILGANFARQAQTVMELSTRLRTLLGLIYGRLSSATHGDKDTPKAKPGSLLQFQDLGEHIIEAIQACALLQEVGPSNTLDIGCLAQWHTDAWRGITEYSADLESLSLIHPWTEAWSLTKTILDYRRRFQAAADQGCLG